MTMRLLLIAGLLWTCAAHAVTPLKVTQFAPGLYVHRGQDDVATRANKGDIANIGFIVGGTGARDRHWWHRRGRRALRAAIRAA